jgi:Raf kinase inhibitor-like YbhB/YbcL family protein
MRPAAQNAWEERVRRGAGACAVLLAVLALSSGCSGGSHQASHPTSAAAPAAARASPAASSLQLASPAFAPGGAIPARYTCKGDGVSPPLNIAGVPTGARSLALTIEDLDAPGGTFIHWTMWDLDPATSTISEGSTPAGAVQGTNSFGQQRYSGPCPPAGQTHRYIFTLYVLDAPLSLAAGAQPAQLRTALQGHVLAQAQLMGRFGGQ